MATEREKMLSGELYDPLAPELAALRTRARDLCRDLAATGESDGASSDRRRILVSLFGSGGDTVWLQPGARVRHPLFGVGTVVRSEGSGTELKVTVSFATTGAKKLVARFAGLEPL